MADDDRREPITAADIADIAKMIVAAIVFSEIGAVIVTIGAVIWLAN